MTKFISSDQISRGDIFDAFANRITSAKAIAGLEHVTDLQMDLIIIMFDALLEANMVQLSEQQMFNYNKLKEQWFETKSTDLEKATYEIDYAFNGSGQTFQLENGKVIKEPSGLKREARNIQREYKEILEKQGYEF